MIPTLIIAIATFILITLSIIFFPTIRIKNFQISSYWPIAILGALILIIFRLVPFENIWNELTSNNSINPLKILILFFSMTLLSIFLDEAGLFRFLANKALKVAGKNQFSLFIILYFLTAILTIFTSNDVVILTFTPFICFFCKNAKINPIPYLVSEFAAANTWSMMMIIGNPTNIYLGTSAGIEFIEYFKIMAIPTIVSGIVEFLIIILIFFKKLKEKMDITTEDYKVENKLELIIGVIHLGVCLTLLVISSYISLEMWLISAICAISLLTIIVIIRLVRRRGVRKLPHIIKRLPWQLIPFIISMFIIVVALNYQGVSAKIGELLGNDHIIFKYGFSSYLVANVINNIPMSILFSYLPSGMTSIAYRQAILASVVGSNIGAFLTPIGALAGIMFTNLTSTYNVKYGFKEFMKYGIIISIPTLTVSLLMLMLFV